MVWCCYKCGMPIYKVVLRKKVKYLNELWGTCEDKVARNLWNVIWLYIAMTERIWNVSYCHCHMIMKCDVNNMKFDIKWRTRHVIFFVTLHKNIRKISTNFIILYLQQLSVLQLKKYTCKKLITFLNIKFIFLILYY